MHVTRKSIPSAVALTRRRVFEFQLVAAFAQRLSDTLARINSDLSQSELIRLLQADLEVLAGYGASIDSQELAHRLAQASAVALAISSRHDDADPDAVDDERTTAQGASELERTLADTSRGASTMNGLEAAQWLEGLPDLLRALVPRIGERPAAVCAELRKCTAVLATISGPSHD